MALPSNTSIAIRTIWRYSIFALCCGVIPGCSKAPKETRSAADTVAVTDTARPEDPLDQFVSYDVVENKSLAATCYDLPHIKEWYAKRILPPPFNFAVDLSGKGYADLRLLRNEIYARNGYLFRDAAMRAHFNRFTWYQPIFDAPEFRVQIDAQEKAFLDRVTAREQEELRQREIDVQGNTMVNLKHVVNFDQFADLDEPLRAALRERNMAIVPAAHDQLFSLYDENQYSFIPNFITPDLFLQLLHKYLSSLMKGIEDKQLIRTVDALVGALYSKSSDAASGKADPRIRAGAAWANTYLAIALSALSRSHATLPSAMPTLYVEEFAKVTAAQGVGSNFLKRSFFAYSQFTPRGNYMDSELRQGYFRCVKWLNSAPMTIDDDTSFMASLLIALWINEDETCRTNFNQLDGTVTCLAGEEDGLSITHVASILRRDQIHDAEALNAPQTFERLRNELTASPVGRINPKGGNQAAQEEFSRKGILFTAGRYTLDAEVLIRMVNMTKSADRRAFPRGLDVFAALGNRTAEDILINTYHEARKWPAYPESLALAKAYCGSYNRWDASLYDKTLESINALNAAADHEVPVFMRSSFWREKNLNTSLAAWTELKHDMILYSEEPSAAEAGEGGGPDPPIHLSYVEPNIPFWTKVVDLLAYQDKALSSLGVSTDEARHLNQEMKELASFLLSVSRKEIAGERVTEKEFHELTWIGGNVESLTFKVLQTDPLPERERQVALVADVYSCNGAALEEAVGGADEIFVIAEINGLPYLTRGACFSYYEFQTDAPLSDEEWQSMLKAPNRPERPEWIRHLCVNSAILKGKLGVDLYEYIEHH